MPTIFSRWPVAAAVVLGTTSAALAGAAPAPAAPPAPPTAIVSLGDSFISGEAGRWLGNSRTNSGSRDGTDRAYDRWIDDTDPRIVYGESYDNLCDRSDVAEIHQARRLVNVDEYINLACSGASTDAMWSRFKGEAPQATQLAAVAAQYKVTAVVLSIGGNDLDVSGILRTCAEDFIKPWVGPCTADGSVQKRVADALPAMQINVGKAVEHIRDAMRTAGYADDSYQFVLQGYPSGLPDGGHVRYDEGYDRYRVGGCPFYNKDLSWVRETLTPEVGDALQKVAAGEKVGFLDLRDTLAGRELCATTTQQVDAEHPVSLVTSEWSRFISVIDQGSVQEALHPNAIAQRALGYCLGLFLVAAPSAARCVNTPGEDYRSMRLA